MGEVQCQGEEVRDPEGGTRGTNRIAPLEASVKTIDAKRARAAHAKYLNGAVVGDLARELGCWSTSLIRKWDELDLPKRARKANPGPKIQMSFGTVNPHKHVPLDGACAVCDAVLP
jgi:hypothetical protein